MTNTATSTEAQIAAAVKTLRKAGAGGTVSAAQIRKAERVLAAATKPVA